MGISTFTSKEFVIFAGYLRLAMSCHRQPWARTHCLPANNLQRCVIWVFFNCVLSTSNPMWATQQWIEATIRGWFIPPIKLIMLIRGIDYCWASKESLKEFYSPHLCVGFLFLILYPAASSASAAAASAHIIFHTQLCHTPFTGRRGTWRHPPLFHVAGVALGDTYLRFAWQAWHL